MDTKKRNRSKEEKSVPEQAQRGLYDLATPRLDAYYRKLRKNVRFPRYYKQSLNW